MRALKKANKKIFLPRPARPVNALEKRENLLQTFLKPAVIF